MPLPLRGGRGCGGFGFAVSSSGIATAAAATATAAALDEGPVYYPLQQEAPGKYFHLLLVAVVVVVIVPQGGLRIIISTATVHVEARYYLVRGVCAILTRARVHLHAKKSGLTHTQQKIAATSKPHQNLIPMGSPRMRTGSKAEKTHTGDTLRIMKLCTCGYGD